MLVEGGHAAGSPFSLGVGALIVFPSEAQAPPGTISIAFGGLSLAGCWSPVQAARAWLGACFVPRLGLVSGTSQGFTHSASAVRPWSSLGADLFGRGQITGPLGWSVRLGALVPTPRQEFTVIGITTLVSPAPIGVFAGGGLSLTFR